MSLAKMIGFHPEAAGEVNEWLVTAARHSMLCSLFCTSCSDACAAEDMDMRACIRACADCADVSAATARLAVRRTGQNIVVLRVQIEACIRTCELCAEECERHDHEHCKLCARMCRECADDCRKALSTLQ